MNMEGLLQMGAEIFSKSDLSGEAGSNLDMGSLTSALSSLSGDGEGVLGLAGKLFGGK